MPKYKNRFSAPEFFEEKIVNDSGTLGTIRVKPSGVLWKPSGATKFYSVSLEKFTEWVTDPSTKARRTGS